MRKIEELLKKHNIPYLYYEDNYGYKGVVLLEDPKIKVVLRNNWMFFYVNYESNGIYRKFGDDLGREDSKIIREINELNHILFELFYNVVIIKSELWEKAYQIRRKHGGELIREFVVAYLTKKNDYTPIPISYDYGFLRNTHIGHTHISLAGEIELMLEYTSTK
jgi:hypothetical protein